MLFLNYFELFKNLPPQLATFLLAMLPVAELRVSIPFALAVYKLPLLSAYFYSVLGAFVPAIFILYLLDPVSKILMKHFKIFNKFFTWLFAHTRIRFGSKYTRYGLLALLIIAATPLPLAGVWTSALAAFLFQITKRTALLMIFLGTLLAGLIVTLASIGIFGTINFFKY